MVTRAQVSSFFRLLSEKNFYAYQSTSFFIYFFVSSNLNCTLSSDKVQLHSHFVVMSLTVLKFINFYLFLNVKKKKKFFSSVSSCIDGKESRKVEVLVVYTCPVYKLTKSPTKRSFILLTLFEITTLNTTTDGWNTVFFSSNTSFLSKYFKGYTCLHITHT